VPDDSDTAYALSAEYSGFMMYIPDREADVHLMFLCFHIEFQAWRQTKRRQTWQVVRVRNAVRCA